MFKDNIIASAGKHRITVYTLFGTATGIVTAHYDCWFVLKMEHNDHIANLYFEDVVMVIEHTQN